MLAKAIRELGEAMGYGSIVKIFAENGEILSGVLQANV